MTSTDLVPRAADAPIPSEEAPAGPSPDQPTTERALPNRIPLAGQSSVPHPTKSDPEPILVASGGGTPVEPLPATVPPTPCVLAPEGFDALGVFAASFQDAQDVRIRIENRLRSGTIPPDLAKSILDEQRRVEKMIGLAMRRQFRRCAPDIYAWVKATPGIGEHLMARLLGTIGHPVIATPHHWEEAGHSIGDAQNRTAGPSRVLVADPPYLRNVAKLWAYCGHGDPARRKAKGMTAEQALALGSPQAKKIVHLLAETAMKCAGTPPVRMSPDARRLRGRRRSPYRDVYETARARYAEREGWTLGHQHAAALRLVGKEILRDLWIESHRTTLDATPDAPASGGAHQAVTP